jgi:BCCT family betaine/carnitine transporter
MRRNDHGVDWSIFAITLVILLGICIPLAVAPERGGELIQRVYTYLAARFGVIYLWSATAAFVFLLSLAFSRYGRVKLGDEKPEYSTRSWASMLFCAGVATGIFYWGTIEWAYYYEAPPFGLAPRSAEAAEWAVTYGMFHWGLTGWSLYCLPALAISYSYYARRRQILRSSAACQSLIGRHADGLAGQLIDILFMVGLLGAAGTSLGLGAPMVAAGISNLSGLEESFGLRLVIIVFCTLMFSVSVYLGLDRGIKALSNINMVGAISLLGFILVAGPTLFIIKMGTNSLGLIFANLIRMSTWTDPILNTGFVENWTVFYWAWWIALGPFMGLFVTRISRGRTIRQVVFGMLGYGSMGCWLHYIVLGNYALKLQLDGTLPVTAILQEQGAPHAIASVIASLPMGQIVLAIFCLVSSIFLATTYDSASYTLAANATRHLSIGEDPARWHRLFWALAMGLLPAILMFIGGLKALQTASLVGSLPLLGVLALMAAALFKSLRADVTDEGRRR